MAGPLCVKYIVPVGWATPAIFLTRLSLGGYQWLRRRTGPHLYSLTPQACFAPQISQICRDAEPSRRIQLCCIPIACSLRPDSPLSLIVCHLSLLPLAFSARTCHNTRQWGISDEAAMNGLVVYSGARMWEVEMSGMAAEGGGRERPHRR
jgi:hypothetical protein